MIRQNDRTFRKKGKLKVLRLDFVKSDMYYEKQHIENWRVKWEEGQLFDYMGKKEIMYFHFLLSKNKPGFHITSFKDSSTLKSLQRGLQINHHICNVLKTDNLNFFFRHIELTLPAIRFLISIYVVMNKQSKNSHQYNHYPPQLLKI